MTRLLAVLATFMLLPAAVGTAADAITFESGQTQVTLLELYTSEGCSSCPPAENWLGSLRGEPGLWQRVVPINLHVDYWDGLGWPDRFADRAYTQRQYGYVEALGLRSAYTPGFIINGEEWRGFFRRQRLDFAAGPEVGALRLRVEGKKASLEFDPVSPPSLDLQAHVAILGFDLATDVRAGENSGRKLVQNFVVLGLTDTRLGRRGAESYRTELELPVEPDSWPPETAIAAWVSHRGGLAPLQAVGGYLRHRSVAAPAN